MFSRSERFKEKIPDGPAPCVGQTDWTEGTHGSVIGKSERFKDPEPCGSDAGSDKASDCAEGPTDSKSLKRKNGQAKGSKKVPESGRVLELEKEIKKLLAERSSLNKELTSSRTENGRLDGKLHAAAKDKTSLQAQVASLHKENLNLTRGKKVLQEKLEVDGESRKPSLTPGQIQAQLELAEKKVSIRNKEIETLRKQLADSEAKFQGSAKKEREAKNGLELELNRHIERASQLDQVVREKTQLLEDQEKALSSEKENKKAREEMLSRKLEHIQQLERKAEDLQQTLQFAEEENATQKEVSITLQNKDKLTEEKVAQLEEQYSDLTKQLQTTREELDKEQKTKNDFETKCAMHEASHTAMENALTASSNDYKALQEKYSQLEKSSGKLETKMSSQLERINKLEEYKTTSLVTLGQIKEDLASKRQAKKIVEEKILSETKRASKLEGDIKKLEASLERAKNEISMERDAKKVLQINISNMKEENAVWIGKVKASEEALKKSQDNGRQLQGKIVNLEGSLKTAKQAVATREQEEASFHRAMRELEVKMQHLSSTNSTLKKENTDSKTALAEHQTEHQNCMASFATKCTSYEREIASHKGAMKEKEAAYQTNLEQLEQDHQAALEALTQKCLTLEEELAHHKSMNSEEKSVLVAKMQGLEENLAEQKNESDALSQMRSDMLDRIKELEEENESLQAENTRVTSAYEEIEERYRPYRDQVDGLEELNHFLRNQTSSAQTEAQKLSDQYTKLLGHQNQKQKIHYVKKIKDENSGMRQEIGKLKAEVTRQKRTIARMEEENAGAKSGKKTPDITRLQKPLKTLN